MRGVFRQQCRGHGDAGAHRAGDFGGEQGLAAQHAVLVGERETDLQFSFLMRSICAAALVRVAPQVVTLDKAGRFARPWGHYRLVPIGPTRSLAFADFGLLPIALPVIGRTDAIDCRGACDAGGLRRLKDHDRLFAFACLFDRLP